MTTTKKKLLTADDLLRLHSEGAKGELIKGVFVKKVPSGLEHGEISMRLGARLVTFVGSAGVGRVFGTDTGVVLQNDPDIVREPDLAFVSYDKLPYGVRIRGYLVGPPDLVVEITSPTDTIGAVYDQARMWVSHGVPLVWVVDPEARTVEVHRPDVETNTLTEADTLGGGSVLPGFSVPVSAVFE